MHPTRPPGLVCRPRLVLGTLTRRPHAADPSKTGACRHRVPLDFTSKIDHMFRTGGDRFVGDSEVAGIRAYDRKGRGLGVVVVDLDDDDRVNPFVADNRAASDMFRNRGRFCTGNDQKRETLLTPRGREERMIGRCRGKRGTPSRDEGPR